MSRLLTLAFTSHRLESLPRACEVMAAHAAVFLEEPPTPGFEDMLRDSLSIDDYLENTDYGFPLFTRQACAMLRGLHAAGVRVLQVEPFLEILASIHERFAAGGAPADIPNDSLERIVYEAEKAWTGALLNYYRASASPHFERCVQAVKTFARADASRGKLRDRLRAKAIVSLLPCLESVCVEAGYIHHALLLELRAILPVGWRLAPVWLLAGETRRLTGRRQLLGPGDVLTLLHSCGGRVQQSREDLLAARRLIYIQLLTKDELPGGPHEFPHLHDEAECLEVVSDLGFEDCRKLYPRLRGLTPAEARTLVRRESVA
ncbi:hypothetical protein V6C53_16515 [Desulfocurvibacter africanus]|uniref:hypothetical protein n=1 Tax=Desulfocurvibacter africanus TaxID=873 RepID=UPI002FD8CA56